MADFKIWDADLHKKYTGVSNGAIKEHFIAVNKQNLPVIARTPVIPEIEQGIERISAFMKQLEHVRRYELLSCHPLGNAKRRALGLEEAGFTTPTPELMKEMEQYAYLR